jgi:predicted Rossmann-fold nucleotide-binding protein
VALPVSSVCVLCGSATGSDPAFATATRDIGRYLAVNHIAVVYGAGRTGLMGVLADSVLEAGVDGVTT